MLTDDQCFTYLKTLAEGTDQNALVLAEARINELLTDAPIAPGDAVVALGRLQERLIRGTSPSPIRADILDMIGDRISGLLEEHAQRH